LGGTAKIETLMDSLDLTIPPKTQNGARFRLRGQGMPRLKGEGYGDLYATARVVLPTKLTAEEEELFRRLHQLQRPD
jgi:curved DNA-binding protein